MQVARALVTGASSGIGEQFARQLAARGVDLVLVARRRERLDAVASELGTGGREVEVMAGDLTDPADIRAVETRVADTAKPVDLLVNNAGFGLYGPFTQLAADRQQEMITLNVLALTRLTRAALPGMVARGAGGVINVASTAAFQPDPHGAVYGATKAFVRSLTEAIHDELAGEAVRAMVLCPGFTATEFQQVAGVADGSAPASGVMAVAPVVSAALRDFARGRAVCIPGVLNRISATGADLSPSVLTRRLSGMVHRGFTAP